MRTSSPRQPTPPGECASGARNTDSLDGYVQIFRDGSLEAVTTTLIRQTADPRRADLSVQILVSVLTDHLPQYLQALALINAAPPYALMVTLLGAPGYFLSGLGAGLLIPRDPLVLPDVLLDADGVDDPLVALRPLFDILAQAAGLPRWTRILPSVRAGQR